MQMVGKQIGPASVATGNPREQLDFQLSLVSRLSIINDYPQV